MADSEEQQSSSYFQKTVYLDEWWLSKAETEIDGKRLAISGFTSRDYDQAVRAFSSAPVLKIWDVFTLETADGIRVNIRGFINRARTLENGFPSEVFKHFCFGFPPQWEACAEQFLGQGFATDDVLRGNWCLYSKVVHELRSNTQFQSGGASSINSREITKENCENTNIKKNVSLSASVVDPELDDDRGDMIQIGSKKSNKAVNYSGRAGVTKNNHPEEIVNAEKEITLQEACACASDDVINANAGTSHPGEITKENCDNVNIKKNDSLSASVVNPELDEDGGDMIQGGSKKSNKCVDYSGRVGSAKNNDPKKIASAKKEITLQEACAQKCLGQGCATEDAINAARMSHPSEITTENCENANIRKNVDVSAGVVHPKLDQGSGDMILVVPKKSNKAFRSSGRVRLADNDTKRTAGSASTINSREITKENYETDNIEKNVNLSASTVGPDLDEDRGGVIQGGSEKSNKAVNYSSRVGGAKNNDPQKIASAENEITLQEACAQKCLGQECASDDVINADERTSHPNEITKENCENANIKKNLDLSASVIGPKLDQGSGDLILVVPMMFNKAVRSSSRVRIAGNGTKKTTGDAGKLDCSEVTRENHEVIAQKTVNLSPYVVAPDMGQDCRDSVTQEGMKSSKAVRFKRRLRGVENQHCKKFVEAEKASTFKEASTTVKSTKRKLKYGSPFTPRGRDLVSVVSPESFSCKRSRSGRLILPKLEFWRNQTAVYNADRQITGIKEEINSPSRGNWEPLAMTKSEPQRKRKKHA